MSVPEDAELELGLERDYRYRRAVQAVLLSMSICLVLLLGTVVWLAFVVEGNTARNQAQIATNQAASDQRWCATMNLLTGDPVAKPSDPKANPSRQASYLLYVDFIQLKSEFHCG